jgi:AP-2 complex subunit alpha
MPAFPERESSILAVLKKKKPGRMAEPETRHNKSPAPSTNHHNETPATSTATVPAINNMSADLLGLSTPPSTQPTGNTGALFDVLGDIYNMPVKGTSNGTQATYNAKK